MDANRIIDLLTERIALLTKENVFLQARLEEAEKHIGQLQTQLNELNQPQKESVDHA